MTPNSDARQEALNRNLEILLNLLYLIRMESNDPLKVTEYTAIAEKKARALAEALHAKSE
jgi:hypothetical protein